MGGTLKKEALGRGWVRVGRKSYWFMETKPVGVWGGNPLAGRPLRRAPEPG